MTLRLLLATAALALPVAVLTAQTDGTEEIPPPKFPIKLRAPANASWSVKVESKNNDTPSEDTPTTAAAPKVNQILVTKTAPIYTETASTSGGGSIEKWIFLTPAKTYRLVRQGSAGKWERLRDEFFNDVSRYENSDFEDFEWIGKDNYKGVQSMEGRPVYAFEVVSNAPVTRRDEKYYDPGKVADAEGTNVPKQVFRASAWLDAKTLLPVKVEDGRETRTFTFGQAPAAKLSPPSDVLAALREWADEDRKMNR